MKINKWLPYLFLTGLVGSIVITNYTPNTWLTGWDNLHTEFNIKLNLVRSLFAVWQEYQGLGLLGGMGHAADLPRQLLLAVTSLVFKPQLLRYFFHFSMLLAGTLGIYTLIKFLLSDTHKKRPVVIPAVLGAVFYLLNLGSVQYFFVPFEPYSTFWGLFPWEIYSLLRFFRKPSRQNFFILLIINILAIPQGYVQTIFLVYILCAAIIAGQHVWKTRTKQTMVTVSGALLTIFLLNAFWLLPTLYFVKNNFSVNRDANQNYLATEKFFLMNKRRGTIGNFVTLKEFNYDFTDYSEDQKNYVYMMQNWHDHYEQLIPTGIAVLFFLVILLGITRPSKFRGGFTIIFLLACLFFLSDTPLISQVNELFRNVPLFDQLFRNPFTKFIVPTITVFAIFFSFGLEWLIERFLYNQQSLRWLWFGIVLIGFGITFTPVWQGEYISKTMRIQIPAQYFELFSFLEKKQAEGGGRIANFPQSKVWGWDYFKWGARGSGFSWYGVEQPFLDRAFDVWSARNENYYWEITQALYADNAEQFRSLLDKYQIQWVLVDENIFTYTHYKSLYFEKLHTILERLPGIEKERQFGQLTLYHVSPRQPIQHFIFSANSLPSVSPIYTWNNNDTALTRAPVYFSYPDTSFKPTDYYYPFRSLFTSRPQDSVPFTLTKKDLLSFHASVPQTMSQGELHITDPNLLPETGTANYAQPALKPSQLSISNQIVGPLLQPTTLPVMAADSIDVTVPIIKGMFSYDSTITTDFADHKAETCDQFNQGKHTTNLISRNTMQFLRFNSTGSSNCLNIYLPKLPHKLGYILTITHRHVEGYSLMFQLVNELSKRPDIDTFLPKSTNTKVTSFIIPPMQNDGLGYTLHFDNISYGDETTINELGQITINPIPYKLLTTMYLTPQNPVPNPTSHTSFITEINHPNPSIYTIDVNTKILAESANPYLILSQAFDPGWNAYALNCNSKLNCGTQFLKAVFSDAFIAPHVLINNWENGWNLANEKMSPNTIYVFYLPQVLEFLGFILFPLPFFVLPFLKRVKSVH